MDYPTNAQVIEAVKADNPAKSIAEINMFLKNKFPVFNECQSTQTTIYNKFTRLTKKIATLKKQRKEKQLSDLLKCQFVPSTQLDLNSNLSPKEKKLSKELSEVKKENKCLKRKCETYGSGMIELESELEVMESQYIESIEDYGMLSEQLLSACKDNKVAGKNLEKLKLELVEKEKKIDTIEMKYSKLRDKVKLSCTRNMNKKINRRDSKIEELEINLKTLNETLEEEGSINAENVTQLEKLKEKEKKMQNKINALKRKEKQTTNIDNENEKYINDLEKKLKLCERENRDLEQLVSLLQDEEIVTFHDGRYCDEVREVIMDLLSLNVSMHKVNDVIRTVLKKLAGKSTGRLPSNAVKSRLLVEARYLAQSHVTESVMDTIDQSGAEGNCLHGDGTTKYHRHYQNFQITLRDGKQLSMGLKEMAGGDTASEMKAFTEIIEDLADTLSENDVNRDEIIAKLVVSIKNTMSDHGPTNPCFNRHLKILRESLIPRIYDNWDDLDSSAKDSVTNMCNFFCKMHLLPNLATECDKAVKLFEDVCLDDKQTSQSYMTNESGTARLVRTAAKAFHPRGSDECGVAAYFHSFLQGKGEKLQIICYKGNRFNVLFYDAAATYHHRHHIKEFLENWPSPNNLLKAVLEDISNPVYVACLRALGIIDKIITGPFWRLIESKQNILQLNPYLHQMKLSFERWSKNATDLFEGEVLFSDIDLHKDVLYESLFKQSRDSEYDMITIQCLELVMHSFLLILERQAEDQLPGGQFYEPSEQVIQASKNVPTTNKISEKEFASLDLLVRTKPSSKVISQEALIMWSHNETRKWLDNKSEDEKSALLQKARGNYKHAMNKYKERRNTIKAERIEKLKKKQSEKEKTQTRKHTLKVKSTNELIKTGNEMWTTEEEVKIMLDGMADKEKKANLIAQLRFHKNVIKSKGSLKLFSLSTTVKGKSKVYTPLELEKHLIEILKLNPVSPKEKETPKEILVPEHERQEKFIETKKKLFSNLVAQRLKLKVKMSKNKIENLKADPNSLLGLKIKHKCVSDDGAIWYEGKVTKLVREDGLKTEYMIHYDEDEPDVEWMFPLLADLQRGDVIIL